MVLLAFPGGSPKQLPPGTLSPQRFIWLVSLYLKVESSHEMKILLPRLTRAGRGCWREGDGRGQFVRGPSLTPQLYLLKEKRVEESERIAGKTARGAEHTVPQEGGKDTRVVPHHAGGEEQTGSSSGIFITSLIPGIWVCFSLSSSARCQNRLN